MTAGDTDPGRAHSGCRAHSAPRKVVGPGQGHVLGAEHRGSGIRKEVPWHSPERMGSGSLYLPTNPAAGFRDGGKRQPDHPLGLAERQQERVGRGCKRPQADVALGAGPAEHRLWCPHQPTLWGMEGCTAFPASPLLLSEESSPFPQPSLPIRQERRLRSEASCSPPQVPGLLPGVQDEAGA